MELTEKTFEELTRIIHRLTGLVVGREKSYLVKHRLEGVAKSFGYDTYERLTHELKAVNSERLQEALIEAITTKETSFFRDHWFYEALHTFVLSDCAAMLARPGGARHRLRIWSAATSTGQEAYSLAMLIQEMRGMPGTSLPEKQVTILGSDISAEALARAREGTYTEKEVHRGVSEARLHRHFCRAGIHWRIDDALKSFAQFRQLNLLHLPADMAPFQLVLCRNVLIYFDEAARQRVCRHLYDLMVPGGWLALGSAESLYGLEERFEMVRHGRAIFYRKPLSNR
jgi:chemotaxis protein methyltransferase CheR